MHLNIGAPNILARRSWRLHVAGADDPPLPDVAVTCLDAHGLHARCARRRGDDYLKERGPIPVPTLFSVAQVSAAARP